MNSPEPFDEIGDLLRSHKPDPQPSPGLETRIVRRLVRREPAFIRRAWLWFLLPPATALGIVLLWPSPSVPPPVVAAEVPPPAEGVVTPAEGVVTPAEGVVTPADGVVPPAEGVAAIEAAPLLANNPLELEKRALQNDARRAGRFLMDCLPSLAMPLE
jgi:hypothetical protein